MSEPITIAATKIRTCWGEMIDMARYKHQPYLITKKEKPAVIMLGVDDYEDLIDMMDSMAEQLDPEFQKSLLESQRDINEGRGIPLKSLKKALSV